MKPIQQVVDYLTQKVDSVNINNPKANRGAQLLKGIKGYPEKLHKYVNIAFNILQLNFSKSTTEIPAGVAKLTQTSSAAGKYILCLLYTSPSPRDS